MATNTYTALRTTTLSSSASSVTLDLTGVTGYTDLVLVINGSNPTGDDSYGIRFNGDTTNTNYSTTGLYGTGTVAGSFRSSNDTRLDAGRTSTTNSTSIINIQNYSNTTTYKTVLSRGNNAGGVVIAQAGLWRVSTPAISTITVSIYSGYTISAGTTFTVYGVAAAPAWAAKATGGTITNDVGYTYHTFTSSGTFTPSQALSCEAIVIAGGGSGGINGGGGGGAGGLLYGSLSVSPTAYSITVGGPGASVSGTYAQLRGNSGTNSTFSTLTAIGGGGGGGAATVAYSGGSGGGSVGDVGAGAGTAGQGFAGGLGGTPEYTLGGGGGGSGGLGGNSISYDAGAGGIGSNAYSSWTTITSTGVSGRYAGGGGGAGDARGGNPGGGGAGGGGAGGNGTATAGTINTGSGGGGAGFNNGSTMTSGAGGSGIVIIRYAN